MFIVAKGGETYARLRFGCGPGAELLVPVAVDWDVPFPAADQGAWEHEYDECVQPHIPQLIRQTQSLSPDEIAFLEEHPDLSGVWEALPLNDGLEHPEGSVYDEHDFI